MPKTLSGPKGIKIIIFSFLTLLALFIYLAWKHSELFLSYLDVLVWPSIVVLILFTYLEEFRDLIKKITKFKFGPIEGTVDRSRVEAAGIGAKNVTEIANEKIGEIEDTVITAAITADAKVTHANPFIDQATAIKNEAAAKYLSREEVEKYMTASADWGYNMGQLGFKSSPVPGIEWKDNKPTIKFGRGSSFEYILKHVLTQSQQHARDVLVEKILNTKREISGIDVMDTLATPFGSSRLEKLNIYLKDLEGELRRIDPTSAFLPPEED